MKYASKYNTAKFSTNQRVGNWLEEKKNERLTALKVAENTPDEIKNTNIKYLLKR
mgnify:CR=1 FL=1